MIWLYRLQQRLSITRQEGLAILTLTVLFLVGLTVRHFQEQQAPPVAVDSLVAKVPPDSTPPSSGPPQHPRPSASAPINVNTAPPSALEALPGIGPALSERIVTYRTTQRPFQQVDELKRVSGIGPKTLATLRPMVRVTVPDSSSR
ncbi:MAG: helix-hairpin-helix domain-containing protein [Salinibacter sp.]|jgi:DNA uptake protein and related DNA-binding proteins|uniref:ComEA family DNA-binding protein n=1 Tax=Salinibacter sp. TaxID=2065818 RepID=UPI002FC352DA